MPLRQIAGTDFRYFLIVFDEEGRERREADGSLMSDVVRDHAKDDVTDVFFTSHGWKGDVPAAIEQYDRWIATMAGLRTGSRPCRRASSRLQAARGRPALAELAVGRRIVRRSVRRRRVVGGERYRSRGRCVRQAHRGHAGGAQGDPKDSRGGSPRAEDVVAANAGRLRDAVRRVRARNRRRRGAAGVGPGCVRSCRHRGRLRGDGKPVARGHAASRLDRQGQGSCPEPVAPAFVLEDEGPRPAVRRDRCARAARAAPGRRARGAIPPHGPQLRLHRGFGDRGRRARRGAAAASGGYALPRARRAFAVVVCTRHPVCAGHGRLLPSHREAAPREGPDRHDAIEVRHRRRPLLPVGRAVEGAARARRREISGVRRRRRVRRSRACRPSRTWSCRARARRTRFATERSTTSSRAASSGTARAPPARTATSRIRRLRTLSGRRCWLPIRRRSAIRRFSADRRSNRKRKGTHEPRTTGSS